ncbi:MAG: DAK2 domain-containing protein [Oscillospiraceae bacterium]|nr:DAK2 domain-containing protein [Oscillospiraceae bacterium]
MVQSAAAAIENHKNEINELNVFPVPDGDTGTNMSLTMGAGAAALSKLTPESLGRTAEANANALLRGARGNSGVILSLLFRGIAKHLKDMTSADANDFAQALVSGVDTAYKAVMKPTEGTILTVSRLAAAAAVEAALNGCDINGTVNSAIEAGWKTVAETTAMNPVLEKAGVVDAGGKGFMYILEAMLSAYNGSPVLPAEVQDIRNDPAKADFTEFATEDITFTYCTEFIAERDEDKDPELLREFLGARGDSIVLVYDDEIIKTHIHTNEPGVVLTEALTYGQLLTVKIENMRQQHTQKLISAEQAAAAAEEAGDPEPPKSDEPPKRYGIVSVCAGEGFADLFREIGVDAIVSGGQTMNPSTEDILKQVETVNAETVFILPNNKNIVMAAQQCEGLADKNIVVIPTATVPQGVSAVLAFDAESGVEENTEALTEAASRVSTAQITYAARESDFDGHKIKAGEYLALLNGSLLANTSRLNKAVDSVAKAFAEKKPDIITIYYGCDTDEATALEVQERIRKRMPSVEFTIVCGGQPVYYFTISAENY